MPIAILSGQPQPKMQIWFDYRVTASENHPFFMESGNISNGVTRVKTKHKLSFKEGV